MSGPSGGQREVCHSGSPDPHILRRRADQRSAITSSGISCVWTMKHSSVIAGLLTRTSSNNMPISDRLLQVHASVACGQYCGRQRDVGNSGSPDPHIFRQRADHTSSGIRCAWPIPSEKKRGCNSGSPDPHIFRQRADQGSAITSSRICWVWQILWRRAWRL
jgi:hypothetical protein